MKQIIGPRKHRYETAKALVHEDADIKPILECWNAPVLTLPIRSVSAALKCKTTNTQYSVSIVHFVLIIKKFSYLNKLRAFTNDKLQYTQRYYPNINGTGQ